MKVKYCNNFEAEVLTVLLKTNRPTPPSDVTKLLGEREGLASITKVSTSLSRLRKKQLVEFVSPKNTRRDGRIKANYVITKQGECALNAHQLMKGTLKHS